MYVMKFQVDNKWVTISGDPSLLRAQVSLKYMEKLCRKDEVVFLLELQAFLRTRRTLLRVWFQG